MRQLIFLHYILNEEEDSLIRKVFEAQVKNPGENDWILDVRQNLKKLEIFLDFDQIKMATSQQFRTMVDKFIHEKCFEDLIEEKNKKNKVKHIQYDKHEIQKISCSW